MTLGYPALEADIQAEKRTNASLRKELDTVRVTLTKLDRMHKEEHHLRLEFEEKFDQECCVRRTLEQSLKDERGANQNSVKRLENERAKKRGEFEALENKLKEEVDRRRKAEMTVERLEEERDYPFVVPALKEAFDKIFDLSLQVRLDLQDE